MEVRFSRALVIAILSTNTSHGSAATRLRCGGIFSYHFARNLLLRYDGQDMTDRSTGQAALRSDSIGRTVLQTIAQKPVTTIGKAVAQEPPRDPGV